MAEQTTTPKKKRSKVDITKMTPEELEAYKARTAPRPAYLVYKGEITEVHSIVRNAEEALAAVDTDRELKYKRLLVK